MSIFDLLLHPHLDRHGSFEALPLGRVAPKHDPKTLRLASYLDDTVVLPEIPTDHDWTAGVPSWPMYGNDRLGDCTIAAAGHLVQAWTAAAGALVTPDDALLEQAYIPGTGTDDTGRFEVDVLNYWRQTGIAGDQIIAYAYVDPQNLDHVRAAIYLFGGVYTGIALPKSAQGQPVWDVVGDGKTGDSQPGSWGGHAVPYLAYSPDGLKTVTWGAVLGLTNAFHLAYCDELYAPISADFLAAGKTPAGFDLAALQADLTAITTDTPAATQEAAPDVPSVPVTPSDAPGGVTAVAPDTGDLRAQVNGDDDGYYWKG